MTSSTGLTLLYSIIEVVNLKLIIMNLVWFLIWWESYVLTFYPKERNKWYHFWVFGASSNADVNDVFINLFLLSPSCPLWPIFNYFAYSLMSLNDSVWLCHSKRERFLIWYRTSVGMFQLMGGFLMWFQSAFWWAGDTWWGFVDGYVVTYSQLLWSVWYELWTYINFKK